MRMEISSSRIFSVYFLMEERKSFMIDMKNITYTFYHWRESLGVVNSRKLLVAPSYETSFIFWSRVDRL